MAGGNVSESQKQEARETGTPQSASPSTRGFNALKCDHLFVAFSHTGEILGPDVSGYGAAEEGVFLDDTRMLSRFRLLVCNTAPLWLESSSDKLNTTHRSHFANDSFHDDEGRIVPAQALVYSMTRRLTRVMHDELSFRSYHDELVKLTLVVDAFADFADVFEIRGVPRARHGTLDTPRVEGREVVFGYETRDGWRCRTRLTFEDPPRLVAGKIQLEISLAPRGTANVSWVCSFEKIPKGAHAQHRVVTPLRLTEAVESRATEARYERIAVVETDNPEVNAWLERSAADLSMLLTETPGGAYPFAGLPWFATFFGRDGLVTALQTLWIDPTIARGVLNFLAERQAVESDDFSEAQPGKILHEARSGEMARMGETPYGQYYGGVDQTLLFVILAARTFGRTGDTYLAERMLPAVDAALNWAAEFGDLDGDGLIEYPTDSPTGLRNQGWKDSLDAVFHADGTIAEGPMALVEVQAYHVEALRSASLLHTIFGDADRAAALEQRADNLMALLDALYWMPDRGLWAMALDGRKRQVRTLSSNAAHVLFAGAAYPERAASAIATLAGASLFADFGLRTVSTDSALYNPMGYHTGSIWPHDTSLAAAGASRYGDTAFTVRAFDALRRASSCFPQQRLPELFCGFGPTEADRAIPYVSACSPQAWAAGAPFLMVQAMLGLEIDALGRKIRFRSPVLPSGVHQLNIQRLPIAGRRVDLAIRRNLHGASLEVLSAPDDLMFSFS